MLLMAAYSLARQNRKNVSNNTLISLEENAVSNGDENITHLVK